MSNNHTMKNWIALTLVSFAALLGGCGKSSQESIEGKQPDMIEWGEVELLPNVPKTLSLGDGKDCSVLAKPVPGDKLQVTFKFEGKSPTGARVTDTQQSVVPNGKEVFSFVAGKPVHFTLKIKAKP